MLKRLLTIILIASLGQIPSTAVAEPALIRMATTTSTQNSGLTDYLLPIFTADTGIQVHTIAVGTGKALRLGREGDVDVVLVHARSAEQDFIDGGYGIERFDVMYNDYVIVGPESDPANAVTSSTVKEVLHRIQQSSSHFISRGDDSGTHKRELILWQSTGQMPDGDWYREIGQGMGKTLQVANELGGYTMSDRGTWLAYRDKIDLRLIFEGDPPLFNPYGIIAVNPKLHPHTNAEAANQLIKWITAGKAQRLIAEFKIQGEQLFIPSAKNSN